MKALIFLFALFCLVGCGGSGGGDNPFLRTFRTGVWWPGTEDDNTPRESVRVGFYSTDTDTKLEEFLVNAPAEQVESQYTWRELELPRIDITIKTTGYSGTNGTGDVVGGREFEVDSDADAISFNPVL